MGARNYCTLRNSAVCNRAVSAGVAARLQTAQPWHPASRIMCNLVETLHQLRSPRPQHRLNFRPEPHGHRSLRPGLPRTAPDGAGGIGAWRDAVTRSLGGRAIVREPLPLRAGDFRPHLREEHAVARAEMFTRRASRPTGRWCFGHPPQQTFRNSHARNPPAGPSSAPRTRRPAAARSSSRAASP